MSRRNSSGFTLVELLVVIAIIGILIALLLPAVQAAREAARRSQCTNNVKQLSLAMHNYHDTHKQFPPGSMRWTAPFVGSSWQSSHVSWICLILPFIEQSAIHDQINFSDTRPWQSAPAKPGYLLRKVKISGVLCPSDGETIYPNDVVGNNYVACSGASDGVDGGRFNVAGVRFFRGIMLENAKHSFANVKDGSSNTMLVGECLIGRPYICRSQCGTNTWPQPSCYTGTDGLTLTSDNESGRGQSWMRGYGGAEWAFNTLMPPNDRFTANHECMTGSTRGAYTARSEHPGGVNIGMGDGSVRFVGETVDLWTWRAASTMDGSEDPRQPTASLP